MKIVCISDTHLRGIDVPAGDVLIHAGDMTMRGTVDEVGAFARWFGRLPHAHKVVVAGNHDFLFEREPARARPLLDGVVYLQDEMADVAGSACGARPGSRASATGRSVSTAGPRSASGGT